MKGIVFTELFDLVESAHGYETVDKIISDCNLSNDGAYTSVGTYDVSELVQIVGALSKELDTAPAELINTFGRHLYRQFTSKNNELVCNFNNAFDLLSHVDDIIHVEVLKLWPNAELPKFDCERNGANQLVMVYKSSRPFADLAEGLIQECISSFDDPIELQRLDLCDDGTHSRFTLTISR